MSTIVHSAYFTEDVQKKSSHYHDCHQIIFIKEGKVEIEVNKNLYIANEGSLAIFSRFESHSINILSSKYKRYILRISPFAENIENKIYSLFFNRPPGFCNIINTQDKHKLFEEIFDKIIYEKTSSAPMSAEMLDLLINQLIIMIYRLQSNSFSFIEEKKFDIIYQIQRQFENNLDKEYTLSELSKQYHISPSTLSHQFKKATGFSVFEYLNSCRYASAKNYLLKTNMSVNEIIEKCGFTNNSNFSRSFKKLTGMTPSFFRKKYKNT